MTPVASFTKEINPRLAKRPLKTNGLLANCRLTSLVKEATGGVHQCLRVKIHQEHINYACNNTTYITIYLDTAVKICIVIQKIESTYVSSDQAIYSIIHMQLLASCKMSRNSIYYMHLVGVKRYTLHAVHSTAWWTHFEGLWKGPVYSFSAWL